MSTNLIIGYGNPLRGDDAAGFQAAERLGGLAVHQLTPELMEPISQAGSVIFIDAKAAGVPGAIAERPLEPGAAGAPFTHHATPEALLAGARALYGRCPPAILITITGADFEIGHPLSPRVSQALETLVRAPRLLVFQSIASENRSSTPPSRGVL
jgi:hydrogenase maturation protease